MGSRLCVKVLRGRATCPTSLLIWPCLYVLPMRGPTFLVQNAHSSDGVYQFGRGLVAVFVNDQQTKELAKAHAVQVLHVEAFLHLDWERAVQGWFLERPALLEILTRVYSWVRS